MAPSSKFQKNLGGLAMGRAKTALPPAEPPSPAVQKVIDSIEWAELALAPPSKFHPNPMNAKFEAEKTEDDYENLEHGIREQNQILEPILVAPMPGVPGEFLIIAGHSRWTVMTRIVAEEPAWGVHRGKIPYRLALDDLSSQKMQQLVNITNTERKEYSEDVRLLADVESYPDYFPDSDSVGRVRKDGDRLSQDERAARLNRSPSKFTRDLQLVRRAREFMRLRGSETLTIADLALAREEINAERRSKQEEPTPPPAQPVEAGAATSSNRASEQESPMPPAPRKEPVQRPPVQRVAVSRLLLKLSVEERQRIVPLLRQFLSDLVEDRLLSTTAYRDLAADIERNSKTE